VSDLTDDELVSWLVAVRADGGGLDPAPMDMVTAAMFDARAHEQRPCCVCGYRMATSAYIAYTANGSRWFDTCWTDYRRVRELNKVDIPYPNG
jgi:hypothetical protein